MASIYRQDPTTGETTRLHVLRRELPPPSLEEKIDAAITGEPLRGWWNQHVREREMEAIRERERHHAQLYEWKIVAGVLALLLIMAVGALIQRA